jgi:hypothetical protein
MKFEYTIAISDADKQTKNVYSYVNRLGMEIRYDIDKPYQFEAEMRVETPEQAMAIVASFPQSLRVKANSVAVDGYKLQGSVYFRVQLSSNGVNKGENETGLRRIRNFFKACAKLGYTAESLEKRKYSNQSPETAEFYGWR